MLLLLLLLLLAVLSCCEIMPAWLLGVSLTSVQEYNRQVLNAKAGISCSSFHNAPAS